jgi:hypothetical protein
MDDLKKGQEAYEKLYAEYNTKTSTAIKDDKAKSKAPTPRSGN